MGGVRQSSERDSRLRVSGCGDNHWRSCERPSRGFRRQGGDIQHGGVGAEGVCVECMVCGVLLNTLTRQLYSICVPENGHNKEVYHIYCASIYQINVQPSPATDVACIVYGNSCHFE
jgi:hypothetical protein